MTGLSVLMCVAALAVPPVSIDVSKPPARQISEYNLFKDNALQIPNDGLLPYDLNTPLYSDYANKHRFVWLPEGTRAEYHERDVFTFPVGSVIVKTFGFLHDIRDPAKGERIIETRLLVHKPEGWVGFGYIWKDDMSDARLAVAGGRADVSWTHYDGQERKLDRYIIPNMNECKQCHEIGGKLQPIGPKARHLNKDFAYGDTRENQLTHWMAAGYLGGAPAPENAPRLPNAEDPATGTLNERARAYLDINCAHCHNPQGPAHMSGLDLSYDQLDAGKYGVFKSPIAAGRGSGGYKFGIEPGHPEVSILMHRIESTEPGVMMPPLPKRMIHDEGNALLREWILEMQAKVTEGNTVELVE
jgi:uncharacterized repeat protein (TIGR03806 family)